MPTPQHTLVRFAGEIRDGWETSTDDHPLGMNAYYPGFQRDEQFVFLCHIFQMPGHCMLIRLANNQIHGPSHTEDYEEVPEDET